MLSLRFRRESLRRILAVSKAPGWLPGNDTCNPGRRPRIR
jgi:hypothetical protein